MRERRGFADESWRLALAGDTAALDRAGALLEGDEATYDGHRARAFALSVRGDLEEALAELDDGRTEDWPFRAAYAADIARVLYLGGAWERSLDALRQAAHGSDRLDPAVADLVVAVVRRAPRLRLRALRVVLEAGTPLQRLRNAATVASVRGC
jgi:hypothetical protein